MENSHLNYVKQVAGLARDRLPIEARPALDSQLTYSLGRPGLRGITYYSQWQNGHTEPVPFVEICALGEENDVQLAATTIHELGHVLAGHGAGHGPKWKAACALLGLRRVKMHQTYTMAQFEPALREQIAALISPTDGKAVGYSAAGRQGSGLTVSRCPAGIGTRGGKSRGTGSGSRMRKYVCACAPAVIVRAGRDNLDATCNHCKARFTLV